MSDITNVPNFSVFLKDQGYKFGYAIDHKFKALEQSVTQRIDSEVAALTGQDEQFNQLIANLLKITDAQPGTEEWDEGQNLYTLLQNNYVALADRIDTAESKIHALEQWKTTMLQDYTSTITAINGRIDSEVAAREQAVHDLKTQIDANKTKGNENAGKVSALELRMADAEEEITALKAKRDEHANRLALIESKFADLTLGNSFPEFWAGLNGEASPSGIAAPVLN